MENLNKIFLDCGTNLGQGLAEFIDKKIIDTTFKIHCFEPNPYAFEFAKNRFSKKEYDDWNLNFYHKAIWVDDCKKIFTLETIDHEYETKYTGKVTSKDLKTGGASNIIGNDWIKPDYIDSKNISNDLHVDCINFSNFLKNNFNISDYIICKMDIEGAEYQVLNHLIETNTISLIKEIYIEWHQRLVPNITNTQNYLIKELNKQNIVIHYWR
jgi:FkbM family methyltransferase